MFHPRCELEIPPKLILSVPQPPPPGCLKPRLILQDALDISLKLAHSIPLSDIMAFPKVGKAYFTLLEVLCHNHTSFLAATPAPTFAFLLSSLDAGLKSLDVSISSMCATAVDNLAGFYFKAMNGDEPPSRAAQVGDPPFSPAPTQTNTLVSLS